MLTVCVRNETYAGTHMQPKISSIFGLLFLFIFIILYYKYYVYCCLPYDVVFMIFLRCSITKTERESRSRLSWWAAHKWNEFEWANSRKTSIDFIVCINFYSSLWFTQIRINAFAQFKVYVRTERLISMAFAISFSHSRVRLRNAM